MHSHWIAILEFAVMFASLGCNMVIAVIQSQHRKLIEKRRQSMNRRHVATMLLIIAAGALASCKSHSHQADSQFPGMRVSRAEAGDTTARPSPRQSSYSSNQPDQADEDSQAAVRGSDTDSPDPDSPETPNSTRLDLASWTPQTAGDSSATVTLPPNWRLSEVANGAVAVAGPNRQKVVLGFQTFVAPGSGPYAPYMRPEQALDWITRIQGIQLLRVLERELAGQMNPSGEAEYLTVITRQQDGSIYKGLALVMTNQMEMNTWRLHVSSIAAPAEQYDATAPTMKAIWNSWKLADSYINDGRDRAAQIRADTGNVAMRDAGRSSQAFNDQFTDMDNTINDVSIMRNNDTGRRYDTQLGTERQYIRNCERRGISCSQVSPTNSRDRSERPGAIRQQEDPTSIGMFARIQSV